MHSYTLGYTFNLLFFSLRIGKHLERYLFHRLNRHTRLYNHLVAYTRQRASELHLVHRICPAQVGYNQWCQKRCLQKYFLHSWSRIRFCSGMSYQLVNTHDSYQCMNIIQSQVLHLRITHMDCSLPIPKAAELFPQHKECNLQSIYPSQTDYRFQVSKE